MILQLKYLGLNAYHAYDYELNVAKVDLIDVLFRPYYLGHLTMRTNSIPLKSIISQLNSNRNHAALNPQVNL